jgi:hypothetical protein
MLPILSALIAPLGQQSLLLQRMLQGLVIGFCQYLRTTPYVER